MKNCSQQDNPVESWTFEQLTPTNWTLVCTSNFDPATLRAFKTNESVINLRLIHGEKYKVIELKTGVRAHRARKLINRALTPMPNGEPAGWLACIPHFRIKTYERSTNKTGGKAGLMTQFLEKHQITESVDKLVLGKMKVNGLRIQGRFFALLYRGFKKISIDAGVDVLTEYPFTNVDGGREAIRNYTDKIRGQHFIDAVRVEQGGKIARMASAIGKKSIFAPRSPLPYESVQLDGHLLDSIITVTEWDGSGNEQYKVLSRLWVIVLIDVGSRAVLGYSLSLRKNYSSQDVINCFAKALEPWQPVLTPNPKPVYLKGAGLPGGAFKPCEGRLFNQLRLDNAFAHLSSWVRERIMNCGIPEIVYNRPASPRQNAVVERFMGTLEEISFHQIPNTTGSKPTDIRRRHPEKEAAKHKITIDHLSQLLDMSIANYNATPHHSLNGRTPLEYIEYHLNQSHLPPRHYSGDSIADLSLYERDFPVTIRANKEQGHPPSIQFKNARYTSDALRLRGDLAGKKAFLRVNTNDIRFGDLFDLKGIFVASVEVEERWLEREHSLSLRIEINKLTNEKYICSLDPDPTGAYYLFIKEAAKNNKDYRNKVLDYENLFGEPVELENINDDKHPDDNVEDKEGDDDDDDPISFQNLDFSEN